MSDDVAAVVAAHVRDVPDFPEPGVLFKDVMPLLATPEAREQVVRDMARRHRGGVDVVVGIEARGFVLGAMLAHELRLPFVTVRKPGKLPGTVHGADYALEYGTARLEVQDGALTADQRVLLVDDVLATGGTAVAAVGLVRRSGATPVALEVLLEIAALAGRARVVTESATPVHALVST